jgi:hypothetical protein
MDKENRSGINVVGPQIMIIIEIIRPVDLENNNAKAYY